MQFGYCMTYNSTIEVLEYGACPYITRYKRTYSDFKNYYMVFMLGFQKMCPYLMSSCVGH